jgi:hypothetical protein
MLDLRSPAGQVDLDILHTRNRPKRLVDVADTVVAAHPCNAQGGHHVWWIA